MANNGSFMKKYSSYVSKYEKEYAKAEKLQMLLAERKKKADIISAFMLRFKNGMEVTK